MSDITASDLTGETLQPKRRLAGEFTKFRKLMRLDEMPPNAVMMLQGSYIAGAQAAFTILQKASELSAEDAVILWGELQSEILNAMPKREEKPLVQVPGRTM